MDFLLKEKCGIFGIYSNKSAVPMCASGLFSLQHRGQEGFGVISVSQEGEFENYHQEGLVSCGAIIQNLHGLHALGHVRYSTSGKKFSKDVLTQPLCRNTSIGRIALAHNGNLTNTEALFKEALTQGYNFHSDIDTEAIINVLASAEGIDLVSKTINALKHLEGAFSLVIMSKDEMIGLRDPMGIRPLVMGELGDSIIFASETCALDVIGAKFIRDVLPGEIIAVGKDLNPKSIFYTPTRQSCFCIFEYVYFARPNSNLEGLSVYEARKRIGFQLAAEEPMTLGPNHIVSHIPDSSLAAALGYSQKSCIPLEMGINKNSYSGRTFIEPSADLREISLHLKHSVNHDVVRGKDLILIDDSIIRGSTIKKVVQMLREAGTKSIHLRIASPKITHPCFYGIDTPDHSHLICSQYETEELVEQLKVDSIWFLSNKGLHDAVSPNKKFCNACFTGNYPIKPKA